MSTLRLGRRRCPGCDASPMRARCRPRPLDPAGLFWLELACQICGQAHAEVLDPTRPLSWLADKQSGRAVDPEAFDQGWQDPVLVLRFRPLLHDGRDDTRGFLSVFADGRVTPTRGFGWTLRLDPDVVEDMVRQGRRLRPLPDQLGKYESYRLAVRDVDGAVLPRTVGFDWEMGAELNYSAADRTRVEALLHLCRAVSYEAGFRPLPFERDAGMLQTSPR